MNEATEEVQRGLSKSKSEKNKDLPNYCFKVAIKNANGVVKEHIFPKALDLNRPKRVRTTFSLSQLSQLEKEFYCNEYVTGKDRTDLAKRLQLSEEQVKVWFQNRRTKYKNNKNQLTVPAIASQNLNKAHELEFQPEMNQAFAFLMKLASNPVPSSCNPNYLQPRSFANYSQFLPHSVQRFSHPVPNFPQPTQHFPHPAHHFRQSAQHFPYPGNNYHPSLYINQTHNTNVAAFSSFKPEHHLLPTSINMCYPMVLDGMHTAHRM